MKLSEDVASFKSWFDKYVLVMIPIFGYCGLISLALSETYKNTIEYIERRAAIIKKSDNVKIDVGVPKIDTTTRKRACTKRLRCFEKVFH